MGCYSRDAKYTTICLMGDILGGVQRKMISAPTENRKKVLIMTEYIEREAAIKAIENDLPEQVRYSREDAADCIRYMDASDVAPVRHGRWILGKDLPYGWGQILKNKYHLYCSECLEQAFNRSGDNDPDFDVETSYCPFCGCCMDGGAD